MLFGEWKYILHTKGLTKIILGILLVPSFYAVIFLASLWNPYQKISELPISIVNLDSGSISKKYGQQLANQLKKSHSMNFNVTTLRKAKQELKNGTTYAVVKIPQNFSQKINTLTASNPQQAQVTFETNSGQSFVAAKMVSTAMATVERKINNSITSNYFNQLERQIYQSGKSLEKASASLNKVASGTLKLNESSIEQIHQMQNDLMQINNEQLALANQLTSLISQTQLKSKGNHIVETNQLISNIQSFRKKSLQLSQISQGILKNLNTAPSRISTVELSQMTIKISSGLQLMGKKSQSTLISKNSAAVITQPVTFTRKDIANVPNNGTGMAPYLISVALFVGSITLNIIYDVFTPHGKFKNGLSWWSQKAAFIYPFIVLASTIMLTLLVVINHLAPTNLLFTFLLTILIGCTFVSIVTFFNLWLGKTGAWLMLIFMIIQLGGSAGTYPIQLSNSFFITIHPFLPMTISINGLRSTISTGNSIATEITIFIIIFLLFNLLDILFFQLHFKHRSNNL